MKQPKIDTREARERIRANVENGDFSGIKWLQFYQTLADDDAFWKEAEDRPSCRETPYGEKFWFYKNCWFDGVMTDISVEEARLLIMDVFDAERSHFERLKAKYEGIGNAIGRRPPITEAVRIHVWQRDRGECVLCGSRENLEYDHIIPFSKGGSSTARNLQLLCEACNRKKSDRIG